MSEGKSAHTFTAYARDPRFFATWFETTNRKPLAAHTITPTDVRQ